jgi:chorismate mutase
VHLLRNRMELAAMVAEYKKDNGLPVLDAARERVKMDSVAAAAGEEYGDYAREVYGTVMKVSRSLQKSRTGVFGLLGGKLGHSYSPQIHKMFGGYDYALFERAPEELDEFFRDAAFDGINVTIPYKKAVIPYCAELSDAAGRIGSVNTIVKLQTDAFGATTRITADFSILCAPPASTRPGKSAWCWATGEWRPLCAQRSPTLAPEASSPSPAGARITMKTYPGTMTRISSSTPRLWACTPITGRQRLT